MAFFTSQPGGGFSLITQADSFAARAQADGFNSADAIVGSYLDTALGGGVVSTDYIGADAAGYFVDRLFLQGVVDETDGLFLTSGTIPGVTNTSSSFSFSNNTSGDQDLTATAQAAFAGAGQTLDAAIIEFTVNVGSSEIDGISFNLFFGSDEFPEFSDTQFTDIAAVYVNGVNVALFNNDPTAPLSIIDDNLAQGNFLDNTGGVFPIEWDGIIDLLTVRAPLNPGLNSIKIGVADTGDTIYDSGLFINELEFLVDGVGLGGLFTQVTGSVGSDDLEANPFAEIFELVSGVDTITGTPQELDGDIVTGFGEDDALVVEGTTFSQEDLTVTLGSAILDIDTDDDGQSDTTVVLEGNFNGANFSVTQTNEGTEITVDTFERTILDGGNSNVNIDGATNEFTDFGGTDTYTILNSISSDVVITDNDASIINLPEGLTISDALFLSDGVQFTINGNTVTLLGQPTNHTYVFGGTPLDTNAGVGRDYSDTAGTFGTAIPPVGSGPNAATMTGTIQSDGSLLEIANSAILVGVSNTLSDADTSIMG